MAELDGAKFRRARLSVKQEWDLERMHEQEQTKVRDRSPDNRRHEMQRSDELASRSKRARRDSVESPQQSPKLFVIDKQPDPQLMKTKPTPPASLEDLYKSPLSGNPEGERKASLEVDGMENLSPPPLLSQMNALMESLHERRAVKAEVEARKAPEAFGNEFEIEIIPAAPLKEANGDMESTSPTKTANEQDSVAPSETATPTKTAPSTAESVQRLAHLILQQNQGISSMY